MPEAVINSNGDMGSVGVKLTLTPSQAVNNSGLFNETLPVTFRLSEVRLVHPRSANNIELCSKVTSPTIFSVPILAPKPLARPGATTPPDSTFTSPM